MLLGIYLFRLGLSSLAIGLVVATGLAGSAVGTIVMSFAGDRLGRKKSLVFLSLLSAVAGIALALSPSLPVLLTMTFIGMLNGTGTDRSAVGVCMRCRAPVCAACTTRLDGVNHCHACLRQLGAREEEARPATDWWPPVAAVLAGLGTIALIVTFLLLQGRLSP